MSNKHRNFLLVGLSALALTLLAFAPRQDPAAGEVRSRLRLTEFQYYTPAGQLQVCAAKDLVEIKLHPQPQRDGFVVEIYYANGDYSMLQTEGFHIIRRGQLGGVSEVNLVRTQGKLDELNFPSIR